MRRELDQLWPQLQARLRDEGHYIDLPQLRAELLDNLRHYQESD